MTYSTRTEEWATVEWSYSVTPGYRATRTEPAEAASVDDVEAWLIGPRGERHALPDWWTAHHMHEPSLILAAQEADQAAAEDAADYRRDMRADYAAE